MKSLTVPKADINASAWSRCDEIKLP